MRNIGPPDETDTLMEIPRLLATSFDLAKSWPALYLNAPKGNGTPVLVYPGFGTDDTATGPMRFFLWAIGHKPYESGHGYNLGPDKKKQDKVRDDLHRITDRHGMKANLIGFSQGTDYCHELTLTDPDECENFISVVGPSGQAGHPGAIAQPGEQAFEMICPGGYVKNPAEREMIHARMTTPSMEVPTTAIYASNDGVVNNLICRYREAAGAKVENIGVRSGHMSAMVSPTVYLVLADRLAQERESWQPFERERYLSATFAEFVEESAPSRRSSNVIRPAIGKWQGPHPAAA